MWRGHQRLLSFNKHMLNPLVLKFGASGPGPFAIIRHRGRHSGKLYRTPIIVMPVAGGFVLALTFGPNVDWYRNLLATGRASLRWHGREYEIWQPETIDIEAALHAYPRPFRWILRKRGTRDFFRVMARAATPTARGRER